MTTKNECIIKCNPNKTTLGCGYTKIRVFPEIYSDIVLIAGMTGKTLQDVTDELLAFAIENTTIDVSGKNIKISEIRGVK